MADLRFSKVVNSLPATLQADTLYMVRRGSGFDFFATNGTGAIVAYPMNAPSGPPVRSFLAGETTNYRILQNAFAYYANAYLKTGSLKINLPKTIVAGDSSTGSGTFVSMRFRLWEYGGRGTCYVTVDAYLQASGSPAANAWSNATAYIEAANRSSKPIRVRLAYESGNYVILIEKTTTGTDSQWLYLMCALESAHMSNGGAASTNFDDPAAWTVNYATDVSGLTFYTTITPATELLSSDVITNNQDTTAGRLLTVGYMGLGSTLPALTSVDTLTLTRGDWAATSSIYGTYPVGFTKGTFSNYPTATGSGTMNAFQVLADSTTGRSWTRYVTAGVFGVWQETKTTANDAYTNELKNGGLSVWSAGNAAPPDRFGANTLTSARYALPVTDQPGLPPGLRNAWALSGADGGVFMSLPNLRRWAGRTMTFSVYVKGSAAGAVFNGLRFYQRFGSGGTVSSTVSSYGSADGITATTSWQRLVCTVTLPAINDKTLGSNDDADLYVSANVALKGTTLYLAGFKFEQGVAATPFEFDENETDDLLGYTSANLPVNTMGRAVVNGTQGGAQVALGVAPVDPASYPNLRPTLLADFVNKASLDPRMAFARNSVGTCYGPDGFLQTVAANQPRFDHDPVTRERRGLLVEESRTNLLRNSDDLSGQAWTNSGARTIPKAALAPDGTWTATKVAEDTSVGAHYAVQAITGNAGNTTFTYSVYLKAAERSYGWIQIGNFANQVASNQVIINLLTGTFTATDTSRTTVVSAGNGWWRVTTTVTTVAAGGTLSPTVYVQQTLTNANTTGDGVSGIYVWGAQMEVGAFATSYIPTNATWSARAGTATYFNASGVLTTAASGVARTGYAYDGQRWVSAGLIAESAVTNLLSYSEQLDNANGWTNTQMGVTANAAVAPDGTTTADKLVENTVASTGHFQVSTSVTPSADATYTYSIFVKAAERSALSLWFRSADSSANYGVARFDLAAGTAYAAAPGGVVGTGFSNFSYGIQNVGGGWFRVWITCTITSGTAFRCWNRLSAGSAGVDNYSGDGTSGMYFWGAQLEVGTYPTSYIPTTTATAARVADTVSSATASRAEESLTMPLDSWFNPREGTIAIQASKPQGSFTNNQFFFALGSPTTRPLADYTNASRSIGYTGAAGATLAGDPSAWRYALSWDYAGGTKASMNGSAAVAGAYTRATMSLLYIGQSYTTNPGAFGRHNGHIRNLAYYPRQVSDSELQALAA